MHHRDLLLKALKYPKPSKSILDNDVEFATLILWLENTKIRQYSIDDRKALSDFTNSDWERSFHKYLADTQCPIDGHSSPRSELLDWLLNYAISLEYQDRADRYNATKPAEKAQKSSSTTSYHDQHVYTDVNDADVAKAIQNLAWQLKLDASSDQLEQLQAARNIVSDQLLPALEDSQLSKAAREAAKQLSHLDVKKFPLGFSTGDSKTDAAATILRMLYIKDLRGLQTLIDETLVNVQNYTANPKTDASLGRLGR